MTTLNLTWVPSSKAMKAGIVPSDYAQYNINVLDYLSPELVALIETEAPVIFDSVENAATKTLRHAFNNESASAWLAAKTRDEEPLEDTPDVRAKFLHDYRVKWRESFIEGKLGLRRISVTPPKDDLTVEAELIALNILREHAENNGVPFTYNVVNARTLGATYGDSGKTIGEFIANMLDKEKSPKRSARIWAEAQKILDQRAAAKAAMAESEDEDEDDDLASAFNSDEDEPEGEPEGAAA